jgi:hypothetical protein
VSALSDFVCVAVVVPVPVPVVDTLSRNVLPCLSSWDGMLIGATVPV